MYNIISDNFKVIDNNSIRKQEEEEEEEEQKIITVPSFVSTCLTANHSECTGQYIDTFHLFRLNCYCKCHPKPSSDESIGTKNGENNTSNSSDEVIN
ncbi:MAG TPA: hypothetical protein VE076_13030 [Nitrososphaeraceae archaeon]|jgi:hypothetical protein|nr:hypothetical protein [Nitrososphaeraceae archaeon]